MAIPMSNNVTTLILICSCFFYLPLVNPLWDLEFWCSRTPYPATCNYHSISHAQNPALKPDSHFRKIALELALEQAIQTWEKATNSGIRFGNKKEKGAWNDCVQLFDDTIFHLNQTLCPEIKYVDVQNLLSAALTNLQVCRDGYAALNLSLHLPFSANNVSQLINNALAIHHQIVYLSNFADHNSYYKKSFPSWVSAGNRKLLQSPSLAAQADLVVAQDGSGNFYTIGEAMAAGALRNGNFSRFIIYVKSGVYEEYIDIGRNNTDIVLVGDGLGNTIISGNKSVSLGLTPYASATFGVTGNGFIARDITFRNTAGPQNQQAVALRASSDQSVFFRCGFEGYQDTVFAQSGRQFYKQCHVHGTVDIVFGNAAVLFQNCNFHIRRPMNGQINVVTAQGRGVPHQNSGISIHRSRVVAASDLKPVQNLFKTYLGRPWTEHSRTVFMRTFLDDLVDPEGWVRWQNTDYALDTLYYGEYDNFGPGSSLVGRVNWTGYHIITDPNEAMQFTAGQFLDGSAWLPNTGVPFIAGL